MADPIPLPMPRRREHPRTGSPEPPASVAGLADQHGRVATDLRLSLTDHCNLRCTYCMPAEGVPWMRPAEMLSVEEMVRVVRVFVGLGVRSVRLTGGEPLLRPDLVEIVRRLRELQPAPTLSLTTNGVGLARVAADLAEAGLSRVNVSLDTIDATTYAQVTRRDRLDDAIKGLAAAAAAGLTPVKVNAVVQRGITDAGAPDLLAWCLERGYELRFIEHMPLDAGHTWARSSLVTASDVLELLRARFTLAPMPDAERGSAPAERYLVDGGPHTVGIIASVTAPFCGACDRVRVTADGMVRNCLFARGEADLRGPLRAGASGADLRRLIKGEMWRKAAGHGIGHADFSQPQRPMSAIGG